jgi:hypothetical protein
MKKAKPTSALLKSQFTESCKSDIRFAETPLKNNLVVSYTSVRVKMA